MVGKERNARDAYRDSLRAAIQDIQQQPGFRNLVKMSAVGLFLAAFSASSAQVTGDWVRLFDVGSDSGSSLVVDFEGSVFVTGTSVSGTGSHFTTIKYDTDGNELWASYYSHENSGHSRSVAIGPDGNVFVLGRIDDSITRGDYAVVKYSPNGDILWASHYDYYGQDDQSRAFTVDAEGNIYVTGRSIRYYPEEEHDVVTVKLDPSGNELWARRYDNGVYDSASAIALDDFGHVFVTGSTYDYGSPTGTDYVTVKYAANGELLWSRHYDHNGGGDEPYAIAADRSGNVYVTGGSQSTEPLGAGDYATIKYDAEGNEIWIARSDYRYYENAYAIAVDAEGGVYVTGESGDTVLKTGYLTVKYDAEGNEVWARRYEPAVGHDLATAVVVDALGNVYVTGRSTGVGNFDVATIKYDSEGNELWVENFDGGWADAGNDLGIDPRGNVYLTGYSFQENTGNDLLTIKYVQVFSPEELMALTIAFFEEALEDGKVYGVGQEQGERIKANERHFRRMLDAIEGLIEAGDELAACDELDKALQRVDGLTPLPDLITGPDSPVLYDMLVAVHDALRCGVAPSGAEVWEENCLMCQVDPAYFGEGTGWPDQFLLDLDMHRTLDFGIYSAVMTGIELPRADVLALVEYLRTF